MEEITDMIEDERIFQAAVQGAKIKKRPRSRRTIRGNIDEQFKEAQRKGLPVKEVKGK